MHTQDTPNKQTLAPHLEEIARVIRAKIDGKREGWGSASFAVRRAVTRLARLADSRRLVSHSATFRRAMSELQGKELPRASQRREVESCVKVIARHLNLADLLPQPAPKPAKRLPPPKRIKGVNRIRVGSNRLEGYGIEANDRLLVAVNGDVRPGEFGYFEVHKVYEHGSGTHLCHASFYFLVERDETCRQDDYIQQEGVCLRAFDKCTGLHVGSREEPVLDDAYNFGIEVSAQPIGRVVGVEHDRRPIETTLPIRPYDEREAQTVKLDWNPAPRSGRVRKPKSDANDRRRLTELKSRLDDLDDDITDCTARMKLEKAIFDIEHPKGEGEDWNDWSAWEERED
jgi:hypothetical protein